ncbi:OmpH family outer membrane protein [Parvicella tangerina]|uniref:OmpH family outer membrane protein n=1 Tax=Parvicella tangerina TaxID=2829795 RepID=A0A916JQE5_9FLAO|nr:OmpH family outer membrane protein [Parvicella tangerina]CAG5085837.1 hypothetical protein CRYO30217_02904 [Parvicella tangerina]
MDVKKLTIVNVILIIAVIALFVLHFAAGNGGSGETGSTEREDGDDTTKVAMTNSSGKSLKIAWANSDTVTKYYELAKKYEATLIEQQTSAQAELENMYSKYQKKKAALEKEAPILGQVELNERLGELQQLEQQIMQAEQVLQNDLMNKEYAANASYLSMTHDFMQEIGKELGYDYIFSYRLGGQLIYVPEGDDVTYEIIDLLNEAYANHGE